MEEKLSAKLSCIILDHLSNILFLEQGIIPKPKKTIRCTLHIQVIGGGGPLQDLDQRSKLELAIFVHVILQVPPHFQAPYLEASW